MGKSRVEKTIDLGYEKNYIIELPSTCGIKAGKLHGIGTREKQQDSFGLSDTSEDAISERGLLAVLADGMGGMVNGEMASMTTVISCLNYFDTYKMEQEVPNELEMMAYAANQEVKKALKNKNGKGGSTLVAAFIRKGVLYWVSVGDSRIFSYSGNNMKQLNEDHNYAVQLAEKVVSGEITQEEALNDPQRNALTSYMGIEELKLVDKNSEAIQLKPGERVLLVSDGVYNTLTVEEMTESMKYSVEKAMVYMGMQIEKKSNKNQDNYTAILLEIV